MTQPHVPSVSNVQFKVTAARAKVVDQVRSVSHRGGLEMFAAEVLVACDSGDSVQKLKKKKKRFQKQRKQQQQQQQQKERKKKKICNKNKTPTADKRFLLSAPFFIV